MKSRTTLRKIRHLRVRKKIRGTTTRPRLFVFKSNKHIYVQIINDDRHEVLCSATTKTLSGAAKNSAGATILGKKIAEIALSKKITQIVFDRGGYLFHGRIKALAAAAKSAGLKF